MTMLCSLCGGLLVSEPGADWPVCSASGHICMGGEVRTLQGFADAIGVLEQKGYQVIGYNFPRVDGWESAYFISLVFDRHTTPETTPPGFSVKDLPEVCGVMLHRQYDPAAFACQAEQSAEDLKRWAGGLPVVDCGMAED